MTKQDCPYCHMNSANCQIKDLFKYKSDTKFQIYVYIFENNLRIEAKDEHRELGDNKKINYCPVCGRKLNESKAK